MPIHKSVPCKDNVKKALLVSTETVRACAVRVYVMSFPVWLTAVPGLEHTLLTIAIFLLAGASILPSFVHLVATGDIQ